MAKGPEQNDPAEPPATPPPPPPGNSADVEDEPQSFVLSRDLSEVYLLLDNLSADPNTTIAALSSQNQPPAGFDKDKDWIDAVCQIRWPPPQSARQKAEEASLLIRVKDYLNRLAKPASGMTIAFTLMVTQKEGGGPPPAELRRPGLDKDETHWRSSLAEIAFPDLKARADTFRMWLRRINVFVVVWLVLTCFLSWYVAIGNLALGEYASARDRLIAAQIVVNDAEAGRTRAPPASGGDKTDAPAVVPPPSTALVAVKTGPELGYCERWRSLTPMRTRSGQVLPRYESPEQLQACRELLESRKQVKLAEERLRRWLGPWGLIFGIGKGAGYAGATADHLAGLMGTAVLPVFYGLLGAAAAVLRSLSQKIKASTLSPRDLSLSLQQLALGAVVGACIGLFIVGGDTTLIGPVTLSGSAISFVAGFGVEAVFQALEALISRIFNIAPAAPARHD